MATRFNTLEHTLRMLWWVSEQSLHVSQRTGTKASGIGPSREQRVHVNQGESDESVKDVPDDDDMMHQQQMYVEKCEWWERERWTVAARMFRDVRLLQVHYMPITHLSTHSIYPINPSFTYPVTTPCQHTLLIFNINSSSHSTLTTLPPPLTPPLLYYHSQEMCQEVEAAVASHKSATKKDGERIAHPCHPQKGISELEEGVKKSNESTPPLDVCAKAMVSSVPDMTPVQASVVSSPTSAPAPTSSAISSPSTVSSLVDGVLSDEGYEGSSSEGEEMVMVQDVIVVEAVVTVEDVVTVQPVSEINHSMVDLQGLERRLNDRQSAIRSGHTNIPNYNDISTATVPPQLQLPPLPTIAASIFSLISSFASLCLPLFYLTTHQRIERSI